MTIATADVQAGESTDGALVLENVSWETYEALLHDLQEQHLRLTYDEGRLSIVSPLPKHERDKKLVARMIELYSLERDIPVVGLGSTTWRKKALRKGLQPDECY
jgi:Uma2 family endonuclease